MFAITFYFTLVTVIGGCLYALDNWMDQDEANERATHAKHRA